MTLAADASAPAGGGARPLDPSRDLGAIAKMIGEAFSGEMDQRARAALRDMRWMARLSPLVWWWARADPEFRESLNGFVWEVPLPGRRQAEIVGNVSLNRTPGNRRWWIVCNVVVRPEFRRQGIARQLTEATLEEAQRLGAEGVLLQVYKDNNAALQLYQDLGFRETGGETDWRLARIRDIPIQDAPGYEIRPWRPDDGKACYELARRARPRAQQWLAPVRQEVYEPGFWDRLEQSVGNSLAGRQVERAVGRTGDRLAALLTVNLESRQPAHHLSLEVDTGHRGRLEAALLSRALALLATAPSRPVWARVSTDHIAAAEALHTLGFEEQRTLLTLTKDLM